MLYFAFGSNMEPEQMRARAPGHRLVGLAVLRDHQLSFPQFSNHWGGGVASIHAHHGGAVWGILYDVTEEDLSRLDVYEGFRGAGDQHNIYDREHLTVELVRPDDGSVPRRVRADLYVARPSNPSPPSRRYLDQLIRGARHHQLPEDYLEFLETVEVAPEPS